MNDLIDLNELLNLEGLEQLSHQEKMQIFQQKAEILGFHPQQIDIAPTRQKNEHIDGLIFKKEKHETVMGVYFFYLSRHTLNKALWQNFKYPLDQKALKVSPWNKDDQAEENDILYIGQRHEDLLSRLRDHTVKSNEQTQSLKLYAEECPLFEYRMTVFYQIASKKHKMRNKVLCFMLEAIAKKLFPTKMGK